MAGRQRSSPDASAARLEAVFPTPGKVPVEFRPPEPQEQRAYLVGGRLRTWRGPLQAVHSPLRMRSGASLRRVRLGAYPLLTAKESLAALAAAQ